VQSLWGEPSLAPQSAILALPGKSKTGKSRKAKIFEQPLNQKPAMMQ
jgi:hypothetical protein